MDKLKWLAVMMAAILISACAKSSMSDTQYYLKNSQQISPIVVPSGVPAIKQATYYPIPNTVHHGDKPLSLVPPTMK